MRGSRSPIKSIKSTSSKSKNKASEKEIIVLILNTRTHSIFNAVLNSLEHKTKHDSFNQNTLEFVDVTKSKKLNVSGQSMKTENPLKNSPSSFFRTICLQLDILKTADKFKLVRVLDFSHLIQLIEIFDAATGCLSLKTLTSKVLTAPSKSLSLYTTLQVHPPNIISIFPNMVQA